MCISEKIVKSDHSHIFVEILVFEPILEGDHFQKSSDVISETIQL